MKRQHMLLELAERLRAKQRSHPLRVAINGIDASGKTILADELASQLELQGQAVIRASIDDFQRPRAERLQKGSTSPLGYYEDAINFQGMRSTLLEPLGPGGNRRYRRALHDLRTDTPLDVELLLAADNALLLVDGVFLFHPELRKLWDFRIFVRVDFEVALARALERDAVLFGGAEATRTRYLLRYFPAQQIYFERDRPQELADVIIENNYPDTPGLIFQ